jgi:hypothetical protein
MALRTSSILTVMPAEGVVCTGVGGSPLADALAGEVS